MEAHAGPFWADRVGLVLELRMLPFLQLALILLLTWLKAFGSAAGAGPTGFVKIVYITDLTLSAISEFRGSNLPIIYLLHQDCTNMAICLCPVCKKGSKNVPVTLCGAASTADGSVATTDAIFPAA